MPGNTFGTHFRITTFGESHGSGIGVVIDGCPAGLDIDMDFIKQQLSRRKPGQSRITTQRREDEAFVIQSGIFEGKTTGTPIALFIPNKNQKSSDYSHISDKFRPSHADFTYEKKYGFRDYRGGGRSSARETAARVAAGAIAQLLLNNHGITIQGFVSSVGHIAIPVPPDELDLSDTEANIVRCPHHETAMAMEAAIMAARKDGDTLGGIVTCVISNCPVGLGEPVFDKLHADLGKAMLSINAVKGFEYGLGFESSKRKGSEINDTWTIEDNRPVTSTNFSGGIQGGISNGMPINFNVAFKPVATIMRDQTSIDASGRTTTIKGRGRHDPCVVPRAVPIVEAMAALVVADHLLRSKTDKV